MTTTASGVRTGRSHVHSHTPNRFAVVPTPERLGAVPDLRGRGVTVALLDSGFSAHPDLTLPTSRIAAFVDVWDPSATLARDAPVEPWAWHGTQTSVTCAGNGTLSDGVYRGVASEARVVLVKVSRDGRVSDDGIARGLEWVLGNHDRLGIRVVSISLGGDAEISYRDSVVDRLAEALVARGVVVVVAAGNSGCSAAPRPVPPANAPSVITVGGCDDHDGPGQGLDLYCSSFGPTVDGLLKPEILAPANWVAAPIPIGTDEARRAEALSRLEAAPDYALRGLAVALADRIGLPPESTGAGADEIRAHVERRLRDERVVATHYQHVDGTSFAAPIVASVVAQMLEANPRLTPPVVKRLLIETAERIADAPGVRQGYGVLQAKRAVEAAATERHADGLRDFDGPCIEGGRLVFHFHDDEAKSVAIAGDFNGWDAARTPLARAADGLWRGVVDVPKPGRYCYKFLVDATHWVDDPANGLKDADPFGGFNAVVIVG